MNDAGIEMGEDRIVRHVDDIMRAVDAGAVMGASRGSDATWSWGAANRNVRVGCESWRCTSLHAASYDWISWAGR